MSRYWPWSLPLLFSLIILLLNLLLYFSMAYRQYCVCERNDGMIDNRKSVRNGWRNDGGVVVFYNKIPKAGSTTCVNAIAYELCGSKNFNIIRLADPEQNFSHPLPVQARLVRNITLWKEGRPAFYHGHLAFIDFTRFGHRNPIYINVVREPLDRLVSDYYYHLNGDDLVRPADQSRFYHKETHLHHKETFDECVKRNGAKCGPAALWVQIPFFCGMDRHCWKPGSTWAMDQAKRNLISHYLLVGTTKKLEQFIQLLEATMPHLFEGALEIYRSSKQQQHIRSTLNRTEPSQSTIERLKSSQIYQMEAEFYAFAEEQFDYTYRRTMSKATSEEIQFKEEDFIESPYEKCHT